MGEMADLEIDNAMCDTYWAHEGDRTADVAIPVPKGFWRTLDGRILAIKDMTVTHLRNTKAMLERNAEAQYYHYAFLEETFPDTPPAVEIDEILANNDTYRLICKELKRKTKERDKAFPALTARQIRRTA
jgi:hypothetical protein